jgi:hypothetical protein
MAETVPKKALEKPFIPKTGRAMKFPWKTWIGKDMLDQEMQREMRRNKLCYDFKEWWEPSHRCMGNIKFHCIEVVSDKEDDGDDEVRG